MRTAADIYSEYPYLPVSKGVVKDIVRIPSNSNSNGVMDEWVIIISLGGGGDVLKILHVKPTIRKGEKLYLGDQLGEFVRTYHFFPWTEPHMHVELRKASDPLRALGGYKLIPELELLNILERYECRVREVFVVRYVGGSYYLLKPMGGGYPCAQVSGVNGFLDGGIPHYGHASVLMPKTLSVLYGMKISAGNYIVGEFISAGKHHAIFKPVAKPVANGVVSQGIGYFVMREEVKLLNEEPGINLKEGDIVRISWVTTDDMAGNEYLKLLRKSF